MPTEAADPRFVDIDEWPTTMAVGAMLEGQLAAVAAIHSQVDLIARAADAAAARLRQGGRLVYAGAGTSGRIAVQDGVELTPTYGWPSERLIFILAGGQTAMMASVEGAEDDAANARSAVAAERIGPTDVVIGVAASGRTPFTIAAVEAARLAGALTIGIANNPDTPLCAASEIAIVADTGSEAIAGSTRMKAGTAQKVILNLFSTATMLRAGLVYRGLMVNMKVSNDKLADRAVAMVAGIAEVDRDRAAAALAAAGKGIKPAVLVACGASMAEATSLLADVHGDLRSALTAWHGAKAS
ncbi:MAG: N-acetylmuramic acid 6-phosphate etherase [Pseudomonadota bacterium]